MKQADLLNCYMLRRANQIPARLPAAYQEVQYIQATGGQHIDSGFAANLGTTKLEMRVRMPMGESGTASFAGAWPTTSTHFLLSANSNKFRASYGLSSGMYTDSTTYNTTDFYNIVLDKNKFYIDDVLKKTWPARTAQHALPMPICKIRNSTGLIVTTPYTIRYSAVKIYTSDVLQRDLVPAYRKVDNVAGMYDLVNGIFYTNAGEGVFLVGANV